MALSALKETVLIGEKYFAAMALIGETAS